MAEVFLTLVNRGLSAGWLVLAVIAARFLLKKAPRWAVCALWGLVALRLLCPFSPESPLSLIPDAQPVSPEAVWNTVPAVEMAPDATEALSLRFWKRCFPTGFPSPPPRRKESSRRLPSSGAQGWRGWRCTPSSAIGGFPAG